MTDTFTWVGVAVGIAVVTMFIEVILRNLINRRGEMSDPSQTLTRK